MHGKQLILGAAGLGQASALLSPTPPMGFNNWARFECDLNETLFVETANAMAQNGLLAAGYDRINLDDCWMTTNRSANGSLQWDTEKFPKGIPWLSSYVQSLGFHFGIYEDSGTETCGGYAGTLGYEEIDAKTFADWGIDYLKLDGCNVPNDEGATSEETFKRIYGLWHEILSKLENPLIFSESAPAYFVDSTNETDWYTVMDWIPGYGQLARHSYDIQVYEEAVANPGDSWSSILVNYHYNTLLARYQGPGYYNDPDFIIADWPDLTLDEKRSHFALWCAFSAPLILSVNMKDLTTAELDYLTNADLIAVNQDPLTEQATLVSRDGTWDILSKSLANGDRLVVMLNRGSADLSTSVSVERLGLSPGIYATKDLWTGETSFVSGHVHSGDVASHATAVFRLSKKGWNSPTVPTGMIFNTVSLKCLDGSSGVNSTTCAGTDAQVWHVYGDGTIRSLATPFKCLTETGSGEVSNARCLGKESQKWIYYWSGTLANEASGNCLTEASDGSLSGTVCGSEKNTQVFALPVGVTVVKA